MRGDGYPNRTFNSGDAFIGTPQHQRFYSTQTNQIAGLRSPKPHRTSIESILDRTGASALSSVSPSKDPRFYHTVAQEANDDAAGAVAMDDSTTRFVPGKAERAAVSRHLDHHRHGER